MLAKGLPDLVTFRRIPTSYGWVSYPSEGAAIMVCCLKQVFDSTKRGRQEICVSLGWARRTTMADSDLRPGRTSRISEFPIREPPRLAGWRKASAGMFRFEVRVGAPLLGQVWLGRRFLPPDKRGGMPGLARGIE